jgi:hypothetical protein
MSTPLGAMAAWFPTALMREHQGARESVSGDAKAGQKPTLAAFQGSGLGPYRGVWRPSEPHTPRENGAARNTPFPQNG